MLKLDHVYQMDVLKFLKKIDTQSVPLIVTDPPFNIGYKYENFKDKRDDYWDWTYKWLYEFVRVLTPTGSLYIKQRTDNIFKLGKLLDDFCFHYKNLIVWRSSPSYPKQDRFHSNFESIMFWTKSEESTFNQYAQESTVKFPSWDKDRSVKHQMPAIWDDIKFVYVGSVKHPEAIMKKSSDKSEKAHPCQMPLELARRCILFSSNPGDLVVDPFTGSGTVAVAAKQTGRHFLASDIMPEYVELARERLKQKTMHHYEAQKTLNTEETPT